MDKDRKIIVSGMIAGVVIVAIIISALILPSMLANNNQPGTSRFNRADFNGRTLAVGNNSLKTTGLSTYYITPLSENSSLVDYFIPNPPGNTVAGVLNDKAAYLKNKGSYTVYENTTFENEIVTVVSVLTNNTVDQSLVINNTGDSLQKFSFSFHLFTSLSGNTTLYNYTPYGSSPENFTIVPNTFGFSESYSFPTTGPVALKFPYYNNTLISWSDLFGLYTKGSITFNQQGTQISLDFGEVQLPPGDSLDLGTITIND